MRDSKKGPAAGEMLQGTLDMLILRTLVMGPVSPVVSGVPIELCARRKLGSHSVDHVVRNRHRIRCP